MNIFNFVKDAGEKLFGTDDSTKTSKTVLLAEQLKQKLETLNLGIDKPEIVIDGDKVTLNGYATNQEALEKAILAIGNTQGVAQVESKLQTTKATGAPATSGSTTAGTSSGGTTQVDSVFYTVKSGDNLSKIAKHFYGDANAYDKIFEANKPMLTSPDKIYPGQSLRVPHPTEPASQAA